jgi:hypothetical protein
MRFYVIKPMSAGKTCLDCNNLLNEDNHRPRDGKRCRPCARKRTRLNNKKRYHEDPEYKARLIKFAREQRADPEKKEALKLNRARPEAVIARNQRRKERYQNEPKYRLLYVLRGRMQVALREAGARKAGRTENLLGMSREQFREWIEYQFEPEMNWENHGTYWHIDHVKPCASFDLTDEAQQKACFKWMNQRPTKSNVNLSKHDKVLPELIADQEKRAAEYAVTHLIKI